MMHELSAVEAALAKAEEVGSPRVVGMHFHQLTWSDLGLWTGRHA